MRKLFTRLHNEYGTVTISDNGEQTMESNIVLNGETLTGFSVSDIPRQINGWDCGIYVIHYIQHIVNNIDCLDTSWDYVSKKGKNISTSINIPLGRKIRQSIIIEQRRLAKKAALEARQRR